MTSPLPRKPLRPDVVLVDSFARDGLQTLVHEPSLQTPSTQDKVELITAIARAGVKEIEITGFVHPRVVPTLADAEEVATRVRQLDLDITTRALIPNLTGARRALSVGIDKLSFLIAASPTYHRLNSNRSIPETLDEIERVKQLAENAEAQVVVGVATAFICPYEGVIPTDRVMSVVRSIAEIGVQEITLADSVGLAWPELVRSRIERLTAKHPRLEFGLHLHNLSGLAMANIYAAFQAGIRRFDGVVGGLGGGIAMPLSVLQMPNLATEDLVYLFESSGISTGVNLTQIIEVAVLAQQLVGAGTSYAVRFGGLDAFLESANTKRGHVEASQAQRTS